MTAEDGRIRIGARCIVGPGERVPIGWIAVGKPDERLPPQAVEEIRSRLEPLDFFSTVYGLPRTAPAEERTRRQPKWFGAHREDRVIYAGRRAGFSLLTRRAPGS